MIRVGRKVMKEGDKDGCFVVLDEGGRVFIGNMEVLGNRGRRKKIGRVIMWEDIGELEEG